MPTRTSNMTIALDMRDLGGAQTLQRAARLAQPQRRMGSREYSVMLCTILNCLCTPHTPVSSRPASRRCSSQCLTRCPLAFPGTRALARSPHHKTAFNANRLLHNLAHTETTCTSFPYQISPSRRKIRARGAVDARHPPRAHSRTSTKTDRAHAEARGNVLDGVVTSEERILFMMTNHFESLNPTRMDVWVGSTISSNLGQALDLD